MALTNRISTKLTKQLADHVNRMVGSEGLHENSGEYIRSLIRSDMENDPSMIMDKITKGYEDVQSERYFQSTGDWKRDKLIMQEKEANNWK